MRYFVAQTATWSQFYIIFQTVNIYDGLCLTSLKPTHPPGEVAEMAEQNDKKEKDPGLVDELEGAAYDALKHRRKFELQV